MPAPELVFAIALSGEAPEHQMLADLMRSVLSHVGLGAGDIDRLLQDLRSQRWGTPPVGSKLKLQRHGDRLEVVLSRQGSEWRTACTIPG